jgi:phosphoinositide-3-kinase regulatory subunit 4
LQFLPDDVEDFKRGELAPPMDVFSVGCCLAELFTDGSPPFDFSQLLAYRWLPVHHIGFTLP